VILGSLQHSTTSELKDNTIAAGEIGSSLPDFSVRDLEGRTLSTADLRGKVVLIAGDAGLSKTVRPISLGRIRRDRLQS
jgi:hypothetical protein